MFLFNIFYTLLFLISSIVFALLAYNLRKPIFFYLGIGFCILVTVNLLRHYDYFWYSINDGSLINIIILIGWIMSVIFLILSQTKKPLKDPNLTDAFLDDIINSEDEEWDAES